MANGTNAPSWLAALETGTPSGVSGAGAGIGSSVGGVGGSLWGTAQDSGSMGTSGDGMDWFPIEQVGTQISTQQPVYRWEDALGNSRIADASGNPVPSDDWTETGRAVGAGTGGGTAPRASTSTPIQDANGNWGYWRDDGAGNVSWVPVATGPDTGNPNLVWVDNGDGTQSEWDLSTGQATGKTIGTAQDQGSPLDPSWTTELPNGNIGVWNTLTGTFDDSGIPADTSAQPPTTKEFPDGSLNQWDSVAGEWVQIAAAPPKDTTAIDIARMQIAANQANNAARMAFDAAENDAQRAFQSEQAELDRRFQAEESQKGRELTWEIEEGRREQDVKDRQLAAAEAFAKYVNSVDPTALPAFLAAGGGNLGGGSLVNAAKAGASAVTDKALLPAARQLGIAREGFTRRPYPGANEAAGGTGGVGSAAPGITPSDPLSRLGDEEGGTEAPFAGPRHDRRWGGGLDTDPMKKLGRYAGGGLTTAGRFVVGDAAGKNPRKGAKPEVVENPTNAPLRVVPTRGIGRMGGLPRFATGTADQKLQRTMWWKYPAPEPTVPEAPSTPEPTMKPQPQPQPAPSAPPQSQAAPQPQSQPQPQAQPAPTATGTATSGVSATTPATVGSGMDLGITPQDQVLMDEVRSIRENVPQLGDPDYIYRLDFWNQLPTWKKAYLLGLQAKLGIGAEDWEAEAERNRLGGLTRAGISTRY